MKLLLIFWLSILSLFFLSNRNCAVESSLNIYSDSTVTAQIGQNQYIPHVMDIGIGPVRNLNLGVVDFLIAEYGKKLYNIHNCRNCQKY